MALQHDSGGFPGLVIANRYKLNHLFAQTFQTEVWEASDLNLGREVTLKLIHNGDIPIGAGRLNTTGVLKIFDIKNHQGSAVVVSEKIQSQSLEQLIKNKEHLSPLEVQTILIVVTKIIEKTHLQGVPHLSLTPSNVLISNDGELYLTDFRGQLEKKGPFDPEEDLKSLRSLLAELLKLCPRLSVPDDLWKLANNQSFYSPYSVLEFRIILEKVLVPTKKKKRHLPIVFCLFFVGIVFLSTWIFVGGF